MHLALRGLSFLLMKRNLKTSSGPSNFKTAVHGMHISVTPWQPPAQAGIGVRAWATIRNAWAKRGKWSGRMRIFITCVCGIHEYMYDYVCAIYLRTIVFGGEFFSLLLYRVLCRQLSTVQWQSLSKVLCRVQRAFFVFAKWKRKRLSGKSTSKMLETKSMFARAESRLFCFLNQHRHVFVQRSCVLERHEKEDMWKGSLCFA